MKNRTAGVTILEENQNSKFVHLWFLGKLFKISITHLITCFMIININWCVCKCQSAIFLIGSRVHAVLVHMGVVHLHSLSFFMLELSPGSFCFEGVVCPCAEKHSETQQWLLISTLKGPEWSWLSVFFIQRWPLAKRCPNKENAFPFPHYNHSPTTSCALHS